MRKPIIAGNWKMHGSKASVAALLEGIVAGLSGTLKAEIMVFPPFVYLDAVAARLANTPVLWGAQSVSANEPGAFTGEISATMLTDLNCHAVLVGHSERRHLFGETDVMVALKLAQAIHHGLMPILCVGETSDERKAGLTEQVIARQINAVLDLADGVGVFAKAAIAYEPVWAIGTGVTATPEQAQQIHAMIRAHLASRDAAIAEGLRILYGGSVNASNAAELLRQPDVDGALVGGAALDPQQFLGIYRCII